MKPRRSFLGDIPIATTSVYAEHADGAEDIVFIHMSWGGAWAFANYMNFFAQRGYNCHAVDLRGHGKSGGTVVNATMQDYVDDVRIAVEGLQLANPIFVGHSMGGLVALMCGAQLGGAGVISMDGSPSIEVQKVSEKKTYPKSYKPTDAGMPKNPMQVMRALPDIPFMKLMKMKFSLGVESGVARSERKHGISVPREHLAMPLLFVGAEDGTSLPFGIGIEVARAQAQYYQAPVVRIQNTTHPGLLIGENWPVAARAILQWLQEHNL